MLRSSEEYTEGPKGAGVMEPPSEDQQKGQDIAVRDVGGSTGKQHVEITLCGVCKGSRCEGRVSRGVCEGGNVIHGD